MQRLALTPTILAGIVINFASSAIG